MMPSLFATRMPNGTLRQCHATAAQRDAADCPSDLEEGTPIALNQHGLECHIECLTGKTVETAIEQSAIDDTNSLKMIVEWPAARKTPAVTAAAVPQQNLLDAAADVFAGPEKDNQK